MFSLNKLKNWAKSSISDDKIELEVYQKLMDQINGIKGKADEYINEMNYTDERLYVEYEGKLVPISYLLSLKQSVMQDKTLKPEERAYKSANLTYFYNLKVKELEEKIVNLALLEPNNVYLAYINSSIQILNSLIKEYVYLMAMQRSQIFKIDNTGDMTAGQKLKKLKNEIDIRISEIESRLTIESLKRF